VTERDPRTFPATASPSSFPTTASVERELNELASMGRRMIALIDGLSQPTIATLDAAGWHSVKTFSLRAELTFAVERAVRANLGRSATIPASRQ
jgi:hypothetical protein